MTVELRLHGVLSLWASTGARALITVPAGSTVGEVLVVAGLTPSERWAVLVTGRPGRTGSRLEGLSVAVDVLFRISGGNLKEGCSRG